MHPIAAVLSAALLCCVLLCALFSAAQRRRHAALRRQVCSRFDKSPASPCPPSDDARTLLHIFSQRSADIRRIDDTTWADLELDGVFARVNVCESTLGELYLYTALRTPADDALLKERAQRKELFCRDGALRADVMTALAALPDMHALLALCSGKTAALRHPVLCRCGAALWLLTLPGLFFGPWALCFLGACILNTALYYTEKDALAQPLRALFCAGSLVHTAKRLSARMQGEDPALCRCLDEASNALRRTLPYRFSPGDSPVSELFGALTLVPLVRCGRALQTLEAERDALLCLIFVLGEAELANAALSLAQSLPLSCEPESCTPLSIACEELYHPLLPDAVKNSTVLSQHALFTGANASGKSTFLKAVGINVLFAQTLGVCSARRLCTPRLFPVTCMAVRDSLCGGTSGFTAELRRLRDMLHTAQTVPCLFLLDELLKGTGSADRIAVSGAILRALAQLPCLCLATTHEIELTALVEDLFEKRYFSAQVSDGVLHFDYLLRKGVSTQRSALCLLRQLDFPAAVTESALRTAKQLESPH